MNKMKKLVGIKLVIFDFDGTLVDTKKLYIYAVASVLEDFGYEFDKKQKKLFFYLGKKMNNVLKGLGIRKDLHIIKEKINNYVLELSGKIRACKNIDSLKKLKYKKVIVSNSMTDFLKHISKNLGINYFEKMIGGDKFTTKDEAIEKLIKNYKIKPEEAVYVGDRADDCKYARKAGCYCILVAGKCSWSSNEDILKAEPDFVIRDLKDLKKIL